MSARLSAVLDEARDLYDLVIIDSSPLLAVTDPAILAGRADALLLVVRLGRTRLDDARRAVGILRGLGTPILGAIVNGLKWREHTYAYGYDSEDRPVPPDPIAGRPASPVHATTSQEANGVHA